MKQDSPKKTLSEQQVLELLKKVLPKTTDDPKLAGKIYQAVADELQKKTRSSAFEKFCRSLEVPNLEAKTLLEVKEQLQTSFGEADITLKPNKKDKSLAIEVTLPDGQMNAEVPVREPRADESDEQEVTLKFVPFPVCLAGDKELVWMLAKRENLAPQEAGIALTKIEEEFWNSKAGIKLLRDRVERSFAEFIARAPAGLFGEAGLKRHYKAPEPVKMLKPAPRR